MAEHDTLGEVEEKALAALVRQVREGNTAAAKAALVESDRLRKTRMAERHRAALDELSEKPVELARYLGTLGLSELEVADRLGRKLTRRERAAWEQAQDDRLLEVRAVELGRMRRGDGEVPKWARQRKK